MGVEWEVQSSFPRLERSQSQERGERARGERTERGQPALLLRLTLFVRGHGVDIEVPVSQSASQTDGSRPGFSSSPTCSLLLTPN